MALIQLHTFLLLIKQAFRVNNAALDIQELMENYLRVNAENATVTDIQLHAMTELLNVMYV